MTNYHNGSLSRQGGELKVSQATVVIAYVTVVGILRAEY